MTDQTTQTAVDAPNTPAAPGVAGGQDAQGQGDDLDTLLNEYQTQTAPPASTPQTPPAQQTGTTDDLKALTEQVKGLLTEHQQVKFRTDMNATIASIRGDLPTDVFDDAMIEGYLDARARHDKRLADAWAQRDANPKQFERVREQLGREFRQKFSKLPDRQATEDRAAVTAAVRGASTPAPEGQPPNYGSMTDAQLAAEKDKLFKR